MSASLQPVWSLGAHVSLWFRGWLSSVLMDFEGVENPVDDFFFWSELSYELCREGF